MNIAWKDIRALIKYGDKEQKDDEDLLRVIYNEDSIDTKLQFTFIDAENRECCITISSAALKRPVRLTKSMDLITRLEPKKE